MLDINKYRGCLVGGASGDALGYSVEFRSIEEIFQSYGKTGITEYELTGDKALISDDTQMTLFTANGLLLAGTESKSTKDLDGYLSAVGACYREWLETQTESYPINVPNQSSWLINVPELHFSREPGRTSLFSLKGKTLGTIETPFNASKGCGGLMRIAPVALYFAGTSVSQKDVDMLAAKIAALTHGHELGYIPAAVLVHIISMLLREDTSLLAAVESAEMAVQKLFLKTKNLKTLLTLMENAVELAHSDVEPLTAIEHLGEGWVAEETLAIAIYCALKYENDFDSAVVTAVNHSGDSDSTGSVTGNILGAYLGLDKIPKKYTYKLELKNIVTEIADDLYHSCEVIGDKSALSEAWCKKYVDKTYMKP
jgi:ADP-ribosylglycohydrolase